MIPAHVRIFLLSVPSIRMPTGAVHTKKKKASHRASPARRRPPTNA